MQQKPLEFDYQSTTPCLNSVVDAMQPYWNQHWGNPSNRQNRSGILASAAISIARDNLGKSLGINSERLIFTSGATEANNLALIGHARAHALERGKKGHLITMTTEHHAVLDPIKQLQKEGFSITAVKPRSDGTLCLGDLNHAFRDDTFMVSIMLANNEIGVIQPIKEISKICKDRGVIFHSDAAQGFGYIPFKIDRLGVDLMTISSHKIYGPQGVGALIISNNVSIQPLIWGGGQEKGIRAGTLPVPLIVGFGKAVEIAINDMEDNIVKFADLRNKLWSGLSNEISGLLINGSLEKRLPHNLNFTVQGVLGSRMQKLLRSKIVCTSASSCNNGSPSHVLMELGRTSKEAEASFRLSIGRYTTNHDIEKAIELISEIINKLRKI